MGDTQGGTRDTRGDRWRARGGALATAALLGGLALLRLGAGPPVVIAAGYVAAVTFALAAVDLRDRRLPNALVLPGYAFAGAGVAGEAVRGVSPVAAVSVCAAALAAFGVLAATGGIGMGDVKVAGMLALALGACGVAPGLILLAGAAAFVAAGLSVVLGRARAQRELPFGPFLLGAFWGAVAIA